MKRRVYAAGLATALAITGLAGCSSPPGDLTTTPSASGQVASPGLPAGISVNPDPTATGAPAPPDGGPATASTSAADAPAQAALDAPGGADGTLDCAPSGLAASFDVGTAAGDTREGTVSVRNSAASACVIRGYPLLALKAADGSPVPAATTPLNEPANDVMLTPGDSAHAVVRWTAARTALDQAGAGPCQPAASTLLVSVPRSAQTLAVPFAGGPVCDFGHLAVGPLTG